MNAAVFAVDCDDLSMVTGPLPSTLDALRTVPSLPLTTHDSEHSFEMEPYGIEYWEITAERQR